MGKLNSNWKPSIELFSEMRDKGFCFEIDKIDGESKAYIEAPPGYRFKHNGTHCDGAVWGDEELKLLLGNIERCDCGDCETFWKENIFQDLKSRAHTLDLEAISVLGKLIDCKDESFANNVLRWNQYRVGFLSDLIDAFVKPENEDQWLACPKCGMKPKVWIFDNGRYAACGGCQEHKYDFFQIRTESILSWLKRHNGSIEGYPNDELRENWNKYCRGELESMFQTVANENNEIVRW